MTSVVANYQENVITRNLIKIAIMINYDQFSYVPNECLVSQINPCDHIVISKIFSCIKIPEIRTDFQHLLQLICRSKREFKIKISAFDLNQLQRNLSSQTVILLPIDTLISQLFLVVYAFLIQSVKILSKWQKGLTFLNNLPPRLQTKEYFQQHLKINHLVPVRR